MVSSSIKTLLLFCCRVTSPAGSRTSSISHRPGSRSEDSESGLLRSRSTSPLSFSPSRSSSVSSAADSYRNGTNGDAGSPVSSNQNGMQSASARNGAPDKPERKINAKEAISKHRNWFSNFEKNKSPSTSSSSTPGPESVDSARRTSVNKENKPSYVAATGGLSASSKATPHTTPLSPNHAPRPNRSSADSIETYMQVTTIYFMELTSLN